MRSQDGGQGDACGGDSVEDLAEVPRDDDRFQSLVSRGREHFGSRFYGGEGQSEVGGRHHVHRTLEGWLYLAVVLDLFTRKVVGWSMSERIDSRLAVDALEMAVSRQLPGAGLIAHSARGV